MEQPWRVEPKEIEFDEPPKAYADWEYSMYKHFDMNHVTDIRHKKVTWWYTFPLEMPPVFTRSRRGIHPIEA